MCVCRVHISGFPWGSKAVACFINKWKMSFHVILRLLKEGFLENKQILGCSWRTAPSLWVAEGRRAWRSLLLLLGVRFGLGSHTRQLSWQGACGPVQPPSPCHACRLVPPWACWGRAQQLLPPSLPQQATAAGTWWSRVRALLFSGAGRRNGHCRHLGEEFGITLLLLCPVGPTAQVKYLKTAGPGLGLEGCDFWKVELRHLRELTWNKELRKLNWVWASAT